MSDRSKDATGEFSLTQGGPVFRVQRRLGLFWEAPPGIEVRVLIAVAITMVPLVVLAALQGVLFGDRVSIPLLRDLTFYARFLFAVPMLLQAERVIDERLSMAVRYLRGSRIIEGEAHARFEAALNQLKRWTRATLPEIVLLVLVYGLVFGVPHAMTLPVSNWRMTFPGDPSSATWAGKWLEFVSMPVFSFLVLRWLWWIALWWRFIVTVSRLDLRIIPTHPDRAGGLGFLGIVHAGFGAFLIPLSATIAARAVQGVQLDGGGLTSVRNPLLAYGVIALLVAIGPLPAFTVKLLRAKRRGLLEYAGLGSEYTGDFDRKWLRDARPADETLLGSSDIQSLADLGNSFQVIQGMRVVPLTRENAIALAMAIVLPMVPFVLAIMPLEQLLTQVAKLLLR